MIIKILDRRQSKIIKTIAVHEGKIYGTNVVLTVTSIEFFHWTFRCSQLNIDKFI